MPHEVEKAMLRTGANTENSPLMPHAQGTKRAAVRFSCSRATGKKVPRHTPMGSTRAKTIVALSQKGKPMRRGRSGKINPYSTSITVDRT